ncbi:MAG TPA: cupin domain-containing protein [Chitinophagales bacterium]|nr:cupin domain-containing protein [Chitinophagales bacterium]
MNKINLSEKLSLFTDHWNPRIIGELNENYIKLAKLQGDFVWHSHENEDELFVVLKGKLLIDFRDDKNVSGVRTVAINPGEIIVVPKGMEHRPHGDEEVHIMLIEPKSVINTGEVESELTRKALQQI